MAKVIKYQYLSCEVNHGTEEEPNIEQIFIDKTLSYSEFAEEIAKREAYQGKYDIEEVKEPETPSGDDSTVWDELDAAYQEGVDNV